MTEVAQVEAQIKTKEAQSSKIKDLGLLKPRIAKLFMSLLPSAYKAVIVSYQPNESYDHRIKISCVMPEVTHPVQIRHLDASNNDRSHHNNPKTTLIKHRAPDSLWTINYPGIPTSDYINYRHAVSVYTIDGKQKDKIQGAPYLLPNVNSTAEICFGDVGKPVDLRSAYNLFWSSPFCYLNNFSGLRTDFRGAKSNVDYVRRYKSLVMNKASYKDLTKQICGNKFWSTTQKADGVLVTSSVELLKLIPREYWLRKDNTPILIALAEPGPGPSGETVWTFTGSRFTFQLSADLIQRKNGK